MKALGCVGKRVQAGCGLSPSFPRQAMMLQFAVFGERPATTATAPRPVKAPTSDGFVSKLLHFVLAKSFIHMTIHSPEVPSSIAVTITACRFRG